MHKTGPKIIPNLGGASGDEGGLVNQLSGWHATPLGLCFWGSANLLGLQLGW